MTFLYILQSEIRKDKFYLGITDRPEERLIEHNRKQTYSTRKWSPWKKIYQEEFNTKAEAMKKERYLKSINGYKERKQIIEKYKM